MMFVYEFRTCRRRKVQEKPGPEVDISLSEAAPSVGDHDRHETSRTSEAGDFQTDSHNGQASTSEPKSGKSFKCFQSNS